MSSGRIWRLQGVARRLVRTQDDRHRLPARTRPLFPTKSNRHCPARRRRDQADPTAPRPSRHVRPANPFRDGGSRGDQEAPARRDTRGTRSHCQDNRRQDAALGKAATTASLGSGALPIPLNESCCKTRRHSDRRTIKPFAKLFHCSIDGTTTSGAKEVRGQGLEEFLYGHLFQNIFVGTRPRKKSLETDRWTCDLDETG
jgi:hypothetical protein